MGFSTWFARRGAVGGTGRWAATLYKHLNQTNSIEETMRMMLIHRYKSTGQIDRRADLIAEISRKIESKDIPDLVTLCMYIISGENKITAVPYKILVEWATVVHEELTKSGLPKQVIYCNDDSNSEFNKYGGLLMKVTVDSKVREFKKSHSK